MLARQLAILVFAPATVAVVVTLLRRASPTAYWGSLLALLGLLSVSFLETPLRAEPSMIDAWAAGVFLVLLPTLVAFSLGRRIGIHHGGAYLFAASSAVYYLSLGLTALIALLARTVLSP